MTGLSIALASALYLPPTIPGRNGFEHHCLAEAIYFEARGQSILDQASVAKTVLNRVKDSRWPNTICGVTYQFKQMSYTLNKRRKIRELKPWRASVLLAYYILRGDIFTGMVWNATHFVEKNTFDSFSNDHWSKRKTVLGRLDGHVFLR